MPKLPGPASAPVDQIILGRELTGKDLRDLFKILNSKGEFNHLAQWIGQLSDAELSSWGKFLNEHVYQDALSEKGLIRLIKSRVQEKGFSLLEKNFQTLETLLPVLIKDEELWNLLPKLIPVLDPVFVHSVLEPLHVQVKKSPVVPEKPKVETKKVFEELFQLLKNEKTQPVLSELLQLAFDADWITPLSDSSCEWLNQSGEAGFSSLAVGLSEKVSSLNQALTLAHLLNRPAEKLVMVLQEGLRTNPDIIHALSMKWDPIFVHSLSTLVKEVLMKPEDGSSLNRDFWLALPRAEPHSSPTPEFIRLYSILFSGIQKISDPRRLEPQADSGSYRLPLQLNALFLTRFLEEVARQSSAKIKEIPADKIENGFWNAPLPLKEFRFSLVKDDSKKEVSDSVKSDLVSLGLTSALSRLESLVKEQDSGKNSYSILFDDENRTLTQGFSEVLAEAHSVRPFSDITPFLVTLVQSMSRGEGGFNLEIFKSSP
ncbi:MAG: hypothetical protein ACKN9V_08060, partial [Pseudomonadota bacterium]